MRADGLKNHIFSGSAIAVRLLPVDAATERALANFRRQMQDCLHMSLEEFDGYVFHSTLGYRLVEATADEHDDLHQLRADILAPFTGAAATVRLDPVAMAIFDDMLAFPQLKVL